MSEGAQFEIGSEVLCSEGACGEVRRVVVNPVAKALTHLVVDPRFGTGTGRLVPVELVDSSGKEIHLNCTMAEFHALEEAEETHFVQGAPGQWGYGQGQMLSLPLFALGAGMRGMGGMGGLGMGGMGMGGMGMGGMGMGGMGIGGLGMGGVGMGMGMGGIGMRGMGMSSQVTREDRVPEGDVEVRRGERVHATDGEIGRVHGFVIDPDDHHLTHVLLDEGHLWGKRTIAIPISAVKDVSDGVCLSITKAEVGDLPPVDLDVPQ
jgi:sporulation protein YlmC with PRC-barrel domain